MPGREGFWSARSTRAPRERGPRQHAEGPTTEAERASTTRGAERALELVLGHLVRRLVGISCSSVDLPCADARVPRGASPPGARRTAAPEARRPAPATRRRNGIQYRSSPISSPSHGPGDDRRARAVQWHACGRGASKLGGRRLLGGSPSPPRGDSAPGERRPANGASATRTTGASTGPRSGAGAGEPSSSIASATSSVASGSRPSGRTNRRRKRSLRPSSPSPRSDRLELLGVLLEGARRRGAGRTRPPSGSGSGASPAACRGTPRPGSCARAGRRSRSRSGRSC